MPLPSSRLLIAIACLIASAPAFAVKVRQIRIEGLHDPAVEANVRSALSLQDALDRELRPRRLAYLLRTANDEARTALEPFGYYAPTITIQRSDRSGIASTANEDADEGGTDDVASGDVKSDSTLLEDDDSDGDQPDPAAKGTIRSRGDALTVTIMIELGPPVRVRGFDLGVDGAASTDPLVVAALAQFQPRAGEVWNQVM